MRAPAGTKKRLTIAFLVIALIGITGCATRTVTSLPNPVNGAVNPDSTVTRMENGIADALIDNGLRRLETRFPELALRLGKSNAGWNPPGEDPRYSPILIDTINRLNESVDLDAVSQTRRADIEHLRFGASLARPAAKSPLPALVTVNASPPSRAIRLLLQHQPGRNPQEVEDYLTRLASIDDFTVEALGSNDAPIIRDGKLTIEQCRMIEGNSQLITNDISILAFRAGIDRAGIADIARRSNNLFEVSLKSACDSLATYIEGRDERALTAAEYQLQIRRFTSTDDAPGSIHERALAVLRAEGTGPRPLPATRDERAQQTLLNRASALVFDVEPLVSTWSSASPAVDLDIGMLPTAFDLTTTMPGDYWLGRGAGTFYVSRRWIDLFGIESSTQRFTLPGRHLVPPSRLGAAIPVPAYVEGWGLYALTLSAPTSDLAFHVRAAAVSAAVDTGINGMDWSTADAAAFILDNLDVPPAFADAIVAQSLAEPGSGTAAFVGYQTFTRLRDESRSVLGNRFSLRRFHDSFLNQGERPLNVVEQLVRDWQARQLRQKPG